MRTPHVVALSLVVFGIGIAAAQDTSLKTVEVTAEEGKHAITMACGRAWPLAATIGCRSMVLCSPVARQMPPCTVTQGSPSVQATAPRAYRHAASCQLIQSRTRPWASSERKRTEWRRGASKLVASGSTSRRFALWVSIVSRAYTPSVSNCLPISDGAPARMACACESVRGSTRAK